MPEKKGVAAEKKDTATNEEKKYRIVHTIVLGKGETRDSGFVTAEEVGGIATANDLMKRGILADTDAPVRPSEASDIRARAFAIDVARRAGVITNDGGKFTFAGKTYTEATLTNIPLAEIADTIVAAIGA